MNDHFEEFDSVRRTYNTSLLLSRAWSMPNSNTFKIKPVAEFIDFYLTSGTWVDPFANSNRIATITNDLDPQQPTDYHMDALEFLSQFPDESVDGVLFDPPYSPRQVSECYRSLGMTVNMQTTQASYWGNLKQEIGRILRPGGTVLSFSWNSGGVGHGLGFEKREILVVGHGGWHNDTICVAEKKVATEASTVLPKRRAWRCHTNGWDCVTPDADSIEVPETDEEWQSFVECVGSLPRDVAKVKPDMDR